VDTHENNVIPIDRGSIYEQYKDHDENALIRIIVYQGAIREFKVLIGPTVRAILKCKNVSHGKIESYIAELARMYAYLVTYTRKKVANT
jgi:hypothetical protein